MKNRFLLTVSLLFCGVVFATSFSRTTPILGKQSDSLAGNRNLSTARILVIDGMRVILVDRESKNIIWKTDGLRGPGALAALPNGDFLVAERKYIARIG